MKTPVFTTIGAALLAASLPLAGCASTPAPAASATSTTTDAKAGEGSCGGEKKAADGEKKPEGSCGEGSCGEGSCGGEKKTP